MNKAHLASAHVVASFHRQPPILARSDIFKPIGPAIFVMEECFAISQSARDTATALGRIGTVEKRNVLIADIAKPFYPKKKKKIVNYSGGSKRNQEAGRSPMNFALVFKESKGDAVNRGITPAFVEEATGSVKVVEVVLVRLAPEEIHVGNLKITPKMTCRVALGMFIVCWSALVIGKPVDSVILMQVVWMIGKKFDGLGPQGRQGFGFVIEHNGEAIGLVVVLHVAEYIVINVAKEVNFRFDAPVPSDIFKCRVFVKNATIPSTHLMI